MSREIEFELFQWFEEKLKNNGLAKYAAKEKDARLLFGLAMESLVGTYEAGGNNDGPMVKLLQKTIGGASREPWCMSTVQSCLAYAEEKTGIKSPIFSTEHCMTCWRQTPVVQRVKTSPLKYAIVIWRHGDTDSGHTGVLVETDKRQWFKTVEGNTGSDGSRDGDGVYYKKRDWIRNGNLIKVGFLRPFN